MDNLVVSTQVFNKEAIVKGMFIEVTRGGRKTNGIVALVAEKVIHFKTHDATSAINLKDVIEGKAEISVAHSLTSGLDLIDEVTIEKSLTGYKNLTLVLDKQDGTLFYKVTVNGVDYIPTCNLGNPFGDSTILCDSVSTNVNAINTKVNL